MLNTGLSWRALSRLAAAAALLAGAMASAHAGGVAVGVDIGLPLAGAYGSYNAGGPLGVVNVGYRGGHGSHGGRGGYYRGGGGWGWGIGLGIGAGLLLAQPWNYAPPTTVIIEQPPQAVALPPAPPQPLRPEPVIYPRNGQSAQQLEADRQDCNRWATTQPAALNDSSVFMRAVDACMDGRGYTTK
jgi:hypothetical protein